MDGTYLDRNSVPEWHEGLLILMYHAVEPPPLLYPLRGLYVDPQLLKTQLDELAASDTPFVSLSDWVRLKPVGRSVALTFDDAFCNLLHNALPILVERNIPAITYVVAGTLGGTNVWDLPLGALQLPLMNRAELLAWQNGGKEIGSHGMSHCDLTTVSVTQARAEIFDSKKILEDLSGRPIRHFCYPYGAWNPAVHDLVREAGYETSTITEPLINTTSTDPILLHRYMARHQHPYRAAVRHALRRAIGLGS